MKNIHVLPTDKPSRLSYCHNNNLHLDDVRYLRNYQNIYITNNEEIKVGDWFITTDTNEIHKSDWIKFTFNNGKKIILTTDQDLIKDGVQAIPDEFLEWFVKNPSCEEVEVIEQELNTDYRSDWKQKFYYNIIIPKEECTCKIGQPYNNACCKVHGSIPKEEPKQVTLEEEAMGLVNEFSRVGLQQRNEGIACAIIYIDKLLEILYFDLGHDQTARMLIERYENIKMIIKEL